MVSSWMSVMVLVGTACADDEHPFRITTGFDYSSGDYGDVIDTEIWYVPVTLRYQYDQWTGKVTVPYLRITGPGGVIGGGEGITVISPSGSTTETTESGLGDVVASLMYSIDPPNSNWPYIDLTAKVKFPTADEDEGLGTGEYDYIGQLDLAKTVGRFTPLATVGYKVKTDAPGLELDNVWFASGGTAYQFNDAWSGGLTLDYQEASTDSAEDALELFGYLNWYVSESWSVNGYGVVGFTDGSPDEAVGLQITFKP